MDGLRSIMFHGPSPTHCIAAGNVWLDHPQVSKVGCVSHEIVLKMHRKDVAHPKDQQNYDWTHFQRHEGNRLCLRLSERGFAAQSKCERFYVFFCLILCF